jgi:hypothetical protein
MCWFRGISSVSASMSSLYELWARWDQDKVERNFFVECRHYSILAISLLAASDCFVGCQHISAV